MNLQIEQEAWEKAAKELSCNNVLLQPDALKAACSTCTNSILMNRIGSGSKEAHSQIYCKIVMTITYPETKLSHCEAWQARDLNQSK